MEIPLKSIEIMLYFMRNGEINALLGRYGYMIEFSAASAEPRKGHYRPTACGEAENTNLETLVHILQKNLGADVVSELVPSLSEVRHLEHPTKQRYICIVSSKAVEKMRLPFYSGCLRPIREIDVHDIVEVPADGSWVFNRIPMTLGEGWKDFTIEGFAHFSK